MAAIATKEQERAALEQIKKIIAELGPDSYVGTAFRECFDDAEKNIENDWALSMYDRWQYAEHNLEIEKAKARELEDEKKKLEIDNKRLAEQLERELEWRPYTDGRNVSEADYQRLANTTSTKDLSDEEAAELIHREFGFDINQIEIIRTIDVYEINRHNALRKVGELKRDPIYDATDWNYIRFNVCGWAYEMQDGNLRQYK